MSRVWSVALAVLLTFPVVAAPRRRVAAIPPPLDDAQWIRAYAIPFGSTEPRTGTADLARFGTMVGDARIVGFGEASHGTHSFQTMKHRFLEYLVREKGFTVFAYESDWPTAEEVDRYVKGGAGNPRDLLLSQRLWPWQTFEMLDLIEWMREYNVSRGDRPQLTFAGFDMQFGDRAIANVLAFLQQVDPSAVAAAVNDYGCFRDYAGTTRGFELLPKADRDRCIATMAAWVTRIDSARDRYVPLSSADAVERAIQNARITVQSATERSLDDPDGLYRDRSMADNVAWIAGHAPGEKLVLWAHNYHVGTQYGDEMGGWLRKTFGAAYVSVGFDYWDGTYSIVQTGGIRPLRNPPTSPDSYETFFHRAGLPRFIIDLRRLPPNDPQTRFLDGPHPMWAVGAAVVNEQYTANTPLRQTHDILVWIETSTPTHLLY
jgi:erythromycin esterase